MDHRVIPDNGGLQISLESLKAVHSSSQSWHQHQSDRNSLIIDGTLSEDLQMNPGTHETAVPVEEAPVPAQKRA
ncbi:hypothetical protein C4D60_Mb04t27180 [Musa balbisiana]|uniref:Uncharacterized protein n=1 Tax=Musa balbisiana TaxID=52838 RepID=A0A4S8KF38_MUSBA|nr:hypothetical protein C4D60_Mb04t27180 [Musa balbisiana]